MKILVKEGDNTVNVIARDCEGIYAIKYINGKRVFVTRDISYIEFMWTLFEYGSEVINCIPMD